LNIDASIVDQVLDQNPNFDRYQIAERIIKKARQEKNFSATPDDYLNYYSQRCHSQITAAKEIPGAQRILSWLKQQKKKIYICSATPEIHLLALLGARQIKDYFDGVYDAPSDKTSKIINIIKNNNGKNSRTLVIGDGLNDAESARRANSEFAFVKNRQNTQIQLSFQPLFAVNTLNELKTKLSQNSYVL